ncbi:hypothetical protein LTR53_006670 [Teratosphaeriaceae sp. CCFEE 6253]|nr:hypothetical protein LTR53_006670 [Teratosphaeriaceae sp. CCFEE 6253]
MSLSIPGIVLTVTAGLVVALLSYRAWFDGLRTIPGPHLCRLSSLWTYYHSYIGDECSKIDDLHKRYGPVVRIGPHEVSISDGTALAKIYAERGGFMKAPCYSNFDIEGHATIFSTRDSAHRSVRSKAVVPVFSMTNIRAGHEVIEACVTDFVDRLSQDAARSRAKGKAEAINVLNLTRSLALDAVSSYLFGATFGGISETGERMSASSFVDTLVAVGRFFFLPNWMFLSLEMARERFWSDQEGSESAQKIDDFVSPLVNGQRTDAPTYQSRLLKAGISAHETEVQCKDLMFAGTDSTGTNLATLLWHLAKQPKVYKRLCEEIAQADTGGDSYVPQSLPYLDAVVREGLRVSMANPTRFPRIVPTQGFSFEATNGRQYWLPPGTQVGIQVYTLHLNPEVFPDPSAFQPERWLKSVTAEMQRDFIPFGLGSRQCIARNLAMTELILAVRAVARRNVLEGAEAVGDKIEMLEWFNSKIKGEKIELVWH